MNKIKDIIYDKSDILIALFILAVAALVIFWRLGIILEYPKAIVGTGDTENVLTEPVDAEDSEAADDADAESGDAEAGDSETGDVESGDAETGDAESGDQEKSGAGEDQQDDDEQTQEADTEDEGESEPASLWDDDKLSKDYEVNITGTTAYEAVQSMVEAGIFKDYSEYQKICGENGYDHEKMRAGVFTFKKGSTKLDIIKIVNWSKG